MNNDIRPDANGNPFEFPIYYLNLKEYNKIVHEINTLYYNKHVNKKFAIHHSLDLQGNYSMYFFENHGFSDYNIFEKMSS